MNFHRISMMSERPAGPVAPSSVSPLLDVAQLQVAFPSPDGGLRQVIRGVSLDVHAGECIGIVGESGSGKSVTALSLLRLVPGASVQGVARFGDVDLLKLSERRLRQHRGSRIGVVFQDPLSSLNPTMTIGRQLSQVLALHRGLSGPPATDQAVEMLRRVGISEPQRRLGSYAHELSGGMRQRVMIAAALIAEPDLLIADEPTTALDVTIQAQILELLHSLHDELGMATIIISHDLGVIAEIATRVNVMYAGRIVESAPTDSLLTAPRHPYTLGLLRSIPSLEGPRSRPLVPIPGVAADPRLAIEGCPYAPRCPLAIDRCLEDEPPLAPIAGGLSACWRAEDVEGYEHA